MLGIIVLAASVVSSSAPTGIQEPSVKDAVQSELVPMLIRGIVSGGNYAKSMFTTAAERMSDDDYAFRPTASVRSFGELLAHVADSNYGFCATAKGEKPRVQDIEKTATSRGEIRQALTESFDYCAGVLASLDERRSREMVPFQGKSRPVAVVMTFYSYHSMLHYGNVVTYMRLRGKVPPSTEAAAGK